jgi:pilus assembly protein CpaB
MKRQSLIALSVALVLGLVAVFLANTYLLSGRDAQTPDGMTKVAVANVPLEFGKELKPEMIRLINYPTDALPAGSFRSAAELTDPKNRRVVVAPMAQNEVILASKITGPGKGASIAALLPDGMRAVSVRINDVSGVAGFVQPSDTVDVLITRRISRGERDQQVTDVLLQNTRVIAMGQRAKNETGKPAVARTATLEVSPVDAQKLALGQQVGDLSLVLRKPGEQDGLGSVQTVSLDDLRSGVSAGTYGSAMTTSGLAQARPPGWTPVRQQAAPQRRSTPRPAATARAPAPAPVRNNVDVVRGTAATSYEVGAISGL